MKKPPPALRWVGGPDGHLEIIEQTLLPDEFLVVKLHDLEGVRDAIRRLAVRGAPAIGVAAAFGLHLGARSLPHDSRESWISGVGLLCERLASARPTAVNLSWALARARRAATGEATPSGMAARLFAEALAIAREDEDTCAALGRHGAALIRDGARLMTHCNAGSLATAGMGTALAVMFQALSEGKRLSVYVDETRPLLQGARLTAWELKAAGIEPTLICDNMAAHVMATRGVDMVFVGADRIARNGDTANKIGTYGLALVAQAHGVPFYVVAPRSTFDLALASGAGIPIEERDPDEVVAGFGRRTAPRDVHVFNPAFDVTPARLIKGIVTEVGVIEPVTEANVVAMVARG